MSESHACEVAAREQDQRLAARVVAARASNEQDCRELLEMLGLAGAVGLTVTDPPLRR